MFTVTFILAFSALILTIAHAIGKCPLWIPVLLLAIIAILEHIPLK
jgi:hypothetical protein